MYHAYAGIGSRETPLFIQDIFFRCARYLDNQGWTLRSGGAQGADQAFEKGADQGKYKSKEIYLPWKGFEGSNSPLIVQPGQAYEIAERFHPYWHNLSQGAKKLQARNSHQVLGLNLNNPVKFILCYTPGGSGSGGTGQAIRIAKHLDIPVFDAGKHSQPEKQLKKFLISYFKKEEV